MSFQNMYQEMLGIPGMNLGLAKSRLNEAFTKIQNENVWSFQLKTGGWLTPNMLGGPNAAFLSPGTISVQPFQTIIFCDAVASAAIIANTGFPLITQQQIRVPYYSLYNIIGMDPSDPTAVTLKIDRPWMEPPQVNGGYLIYQAYYPAPPGFKRWFQITDYTNNDFMDWWSLTQIDLSNEDPQRTEFDQPEYVVPFEIDSRPNSATYGQMLYELWPHPISQLPYTFNCQCNWPEFVNPTDTVPYPLTEGIIKHRAYETIALWKESQKGDEMERGSGANWQFLVKAHHEEYQDDLRQIRIMDRHLVDLYFTKARSTMPYGGDAFMNTSNTANVGWFGR